MKTNKIYHILFALIIVIVGPNAYADGTGTSSETGKEKTKKAVTERIEASLSLENWMTELSLFNREEMFFEEELSLENWMTKEFEIIVETSLDEELELEPWMFVIASIADAEQELELENWMLEAAMLKRSFRRVAVVSGLIEQQYHSQKKSMRQVTFSTDLIYDTLREYDADHVLLKVTRQDAERELLDLSRTADLLIRFDDAIDFVSLKKPSPMALPIVLDVRSERVTGAGVQAMLEQASLYQEAEQMMDDIRALLAG